MKKLISFLIIICLIIIGSEIIIDSQSILESVRFSLSIWYNNIFPSLFPFFVLSDLLINYGFIELIGELLKPLMNKVFKINSNCAFIFVMSIVSGFPSNAKYTKELLNQKLINEQEATKILTFTHFSNPLFILGTVTALFLNNFEVGIIILLSHYIPNIIVGLLFRNYYVSKPENNKISIKKAINNMHNKRISNNNSFGNILSDSIIKNINTLLLILGVVSLFLIITTILDNNLNITSYHQSILNGVFELTQGLKYISLEAIPLKLKTILAAILLSFGGLSVHMQIISIISETKIKYLPFLIARIIHSLFSCIFVYFIFDLFF